MATKKKSDNKKVKLHSRTKRSPSTQRPTYAELCEQLAETKRQLTEALEQQTATSEILGVIASSPTDLKSVLQTITELATRVCGAEDGVLRLVDGNVLRLAAHYGSIPDVAGERPINRQSPAGRALVDQAIIHHEDVDQLIESEYPEMVETRRRIVARTFLAVPLIREGVGLGVIHFRRLDVRPFSDKQIALIKTFADQAVIAIENVRLFNELKEALEQQTATSEILGVIASSPTDIQPVLDIVAKTAAQLCDAGDAAIWRTDGQEYWLVASHGPIPVPNPELRRPMIRSFPSGRAMVDKETIHIHDVLTPESSGEFSDSFRTGEIRTILTTPLLREGLAIGAIHVRRPEVRPFTGKQIALLKTFASQAVIAIENVRLFKELGERNAELHEALEQQTATSEVLGIISRSPTDVQPVLDAIVESAARVCGIDDVVLRLKDGDSMIPRAHFGSIPIPRINVSIDEPRFRWVVEHGTLHIPDARAAQNDFPMPLSGARTVLLVPLRQQGQVVGTLNARRTEVRPFTPAQIKLLETFADQAVIAIENVRLFEELQERNRDLTEALEQQTATSEILRVIASSPTEIQPVLDAIAESAARLCDSMDATIFRIQGDILRRVASYGSLPTARDEMDINRSSPLGRAIIDKQSAIHVHDIQQVNETEFPLARGRGIHSVLAVPLLREGVPVGGVVIRRMEIRPFNEKQIALLKTFADQAVIAIENVRLFKELQERNAELREALEHQTATSEVLGIISRSPTDVQPVLDAIVESAGKVCGIDDVVLRLHEEKALVTRAHFGPIRPGRVKISMDEPQHRWIREHGTLHVPDVRAQTDFPTLGSARGRTFLAAPLRQQGKLVGLLTARRTEVRPFTPAQIKLLETFADQAVIALENVRLFQELKESLEQQTATSEILGVIASSPTEIQPVLDVVAESAARVCGADDAVIRLVEGNVLRKLAHHGSIPVSQRPELLIDRETVTGHAVVDRQVIHVEDRADTRGGISTSLVVPLMREGVPTGTIHIRRTKVQPFTDKQIALLKTFADQSVIAIENVRLFNELKESLEQQTATSEILGVIASSPTDIQPVLDAIAQSAARVCGSDDATIRLLDGDETFLAAHFGSIPPSAPGGRSLQSRLVGNEALLQRRTIHIPDVQAEAERFPDSSYMGRGIRTLLVTPLLREGTAIGVINIRRKEVKPFTDKQVALLETFASQAVIAIENVRLFKEIQERNAELREALEHQTATAEVLSIISRSPTDVQPVLDAIVESVAAQTAPR